MPRVKGNRLRQVQRYDADDPNDVTTIAEYEYDGKNRRTQKTVTNSGVEDLPNDGGNTTLHYYYDNRWRIIEERNGASETVRQYVWGTRYTDELICIDINGDAANGNDCDPDVADPNDVEADARYFVHQDRNWNVQALTAYSPDPNDPNTPTNGQVVERYTIAPYGSFTVLKGAASGNNEADARLTSIVGHVFAHQGLPFDAEKGSYQNRWREYSHLTANFAQLDPLRYLTGLSAALNGHGRVPASPMQYTDSSGLCGNADTGCCPEGSDACCPDTESSEYCAEDFCASACAAYRDNYAMTYCCNGGPPCKCMCPENWPAGTEGGAEPIIYACLDTHENVHFDTLLGECDPDGCGPTMPPTDPPVFEDGCLASTAEFECFVASAPLCENDAQCRADICEFIRKRWSCRPERGGECAPGEIGQCVLLKDLAKNAYGCP